MHGERSGKFIWWPGYRTPFFLSLLREAPTDTFATATPPMQRDVNERAFTSCWSQVKRVAASSLRKQHWHIFVSLSKFVAGDACRRPAAVHPRLTLHVDALPVACATGGNGIFDSVALFLTLLRKHLRACMSPCVSLIPPSHCVSPHSILAHVLAGIECGRRKLPNVAVRLEDRIRECASPKAQSVPNAARVVDAKGKCARSVTFAKAVSQFDSLLMPTLQTGQEDAHGLIDGRQCVVPRPLRMPVETLCAWWRGTAAASIGAGRWWRWRWR